VHEQAWRHHQPSALQPAFFGVLWLSGFLEKKKPPASPGGLRRPCLHESEAHYFYRSVLLMAGTASALTLARANSSAIRASRRSRFQEPWR
jgi:hypothetical protein